MRGSPKTGARDSRAGQSRRADARLCCGLFQRRAVIINRHERAHKGIFFLSFRSKHESPFTGQTASTLSFTELWQRRPQPARGAPHTAGSRGCRDVPGGPATASPPCHRHHPPAAVHANEGPHAPPGARPVPAPHHGSAVPVVA